MQDILEQVIATGRFPRTTVMYWADWLSAYGAVPTDYIELIDFITDNEQYIGDTMHEAIPANWRKD
jgi:hypothetical protein